MSYDIHPYENDICVDFEQFAIDYINERLLLRSHIISGALKMYEFILSKLTECLQSPYDQHALSPLYSIPNERHASKADVVI